MHRFVADICCEDDVSENRKSVLMYESIMMTLQVPKMWNKIDDIFKKEMERGQIESVYTTM